MFLSRNNLLENCKNYKKTLIQIESKIEVK